MKRKSLIEGGLRFLPLPHKLLRFKKVFEAVEIMSHEK